MNRAFVPEENTYKDSVVIILDRTSSMRDEIEAITKFLPRYVVRHATMFENVKAFGLVTFDDHYQAGNYKCLCSKCHNPLMEWKAKADFKPHPIENYGMTTNLEEFAWWMSKIEVGHGGDQAEAIACAVQSARLMAHVEEYNPSYWLVTDALPHGNPTFRRYDEKNFDKLDDFCNGCPCGTKLNLNDINILAIDMNIHRYPTVSEAYAVDYGIPEWRIIAFKKGLKEFLNMLEGKN